MKLNRNVIIHVLCWGLIILFPMLFSSPGDSSWSWSMAGNRFMRTLGNPLMYMLIFYLNYVVLVPRLLFRRRTAAFFIANVALVAIGFLLVFLWWRYVAVHFPFPGTKAPMPPRGRPSFVYFNTTLIMVLVVGLSVAISMVSRWQQLEAAKKDAERERTQAELSNLRNQLNPHFLLNTLNNIYALTAFDPPKAQAAVGELSKLLRHMLYDTRQDFVPLCKEVAFVKNYIELMKIRLTDKVKVTTDIDVHPDDNTPIAPLIFISIIENAFKHGISQSGEGHIDISITRNGDNEVVCRTLNSNHPKQANDKSGSGIGLEQVSRRLELMYPGHYRWERGINEETNEYYSIITLNT